MPDFEPSAKLTPNIEEAVEFLEKWKKGGPWILTSIGVDSEEYHSTESELKHTSTMSFDELTKSEMRDWLKRRNGRCGIYFHVNSGIHVDEDGNIKRITSKLKKTDIDSMDWLHIDIDPRVGEDITSERNRALSLLQNPPEGIPKPTVIVFSGGGFQGFWKLENSIVIGGDLGLAEEAERYNIQLRIVLSGDECHNADRIMRLPGLVNVPSKSKIAKGRTKQLSQLISFDEELVYPISKFVPSPKLQERKQGSRLASKKLEIVGDVRRVTDFSAIQDIHGGFPQLENTLIDLIQNGYNPQDKSVNDSRGLPRQFNSRSEALYSVVCSLAGHYIKKNIIYSIITDPDLLISEHVLAQPRVESYALRQIEKAHDFIIDPKLDELNTKHAVILNSGGRCIIITERYDETLKRHVFDESTRVDFENRYANRTHSWIDEDGKKKSVKLGKWWFENVRRRSYEGIIMSPEKEIEGHYNLWQGFAFEPKRGDCSLLLEHILENICSGEQLYYDYLLNWMARCVQTPATVSETAIVLQGEQGTGKTFFVEAFGNLFGRHFMATSEAEHITGKFNEHLMDCVVLFSEEAFFAGDPKHQGTLKYLITGKHHAVEGKYKRTQASSNFVHLMMASNSEHVIPAELDERRFFCLRVGKKCKRDSKYFSRIQKQLDSGGYSALLHHLFSIDLSNFVVQDVPETSALIRQKLISMGVEQSFWYNCLDDGYFIRGTRWKEYVVKDDLYQAYLEYCDQIKVKRQRKSKSEFSTFVTRMLPDECQKDIRVRVNGFQKRCYPIPTLQIGRDYFDENFKGPYPWAVYDTSEEIEKQENVF